ncbi:hypothetical protein QTA58_00255 [Neorhizobium sp. CSC1952]|uniref:portal protein n=1 Tax=Neorhizobium sp. CSC1952 TaxID=2978974 RepID=UPI0025A5803A|nr:hypothetical protein [Rhizobium sp. CSC1952]WJR67241.1 hypothetical protein QTA58_00255 [Rhizobium sp. CSC1952]
MLGNHTGYTQGSGPAQGPTAATYESDLSALKKGYLAYLETKNEEIKEQQNARRYYHGSQWTDKQIKAFNQRRQPVVTYNRIGRKINAVVGLLERQRQDPRGFPRTPKHEEGAEIATAVLRYVCDEQDWASKSPICGLNGAVDGIGGVELLLEQGDRGDVEVGFEIVDPSSYFYDPRSLKMDFSDARYQGMGKWADLEAAIEQFPDKADEIRASLESGSELTSNPDTDNKWYSTGENGNRIRIVDHWYIRNGQWRWCIYTGATILAEGESPFIDEKGNTFCKYIMYSANIDHDGDRYGFVRNMKSSQDEINQRRSKGLHILNSRRIIIPTGTGADIEKIRREAARPDGVIDFPQGSQSPQFDDSAKGTELQGQIAFLEDAKNEIENYGFNPALIGQGVDKLSGRAMQIQQQAGIAELGPYLLAYKGWKLRVYRALWNAIQRHWTAERWIRVTDDNQVAQFFAVNQMGIDPNTGMPTLVNALGSLDVDIIIDEGPDTINMQQDAYDTLTVMATKGQNVPPELLIELSPLTGSVKKKALDILEKAANQPPNPLAVAGAEAEIAEKQSSAILKQAQARKAIADAGTAGMTGEQGPTDIEVAQALAEIRNKNASTEKVVAETDKIRTETALAPVEMANQQIEQERSREERMTVHKDTMRQASQDRSRRP